MEKLVQLNIIYYEVNESFFKWFKTNFNKAGFYYRVIIYFMCTQ